MQGNRDHNVSSRLDKNVNLAEFKQGPILLRFLHLRTKLQTHSKARGQSSIIKIFSQNVRPTYLKWFIRLIWRSNWNFRHVILHHHKA
jgi:hypothetical protein